MLGVQHWIKYDRKVGFVRVKLSATQIMRLGINDKHFKLNEVSKIQHQNGTCT